MANDSDACVPQTLTDFVFDLYDSVTLSQLTEEQSRLYSTVFRELSTKYYATSPWPSPQSIASECNGDPLFLALYRELTHRHWHSVSRVSLRDRMEGWDVYRELFDEIILDAEDGGSTASRAKFFILPEWAFDILHEFVYQFQGFCQFRTALHNSATKHGILGPVDENGQPTMKPNNSKAPHHLVENVQIVQQGQDVWNVETVCYYLQRLVAIGTAPNCTVPAYQYMGLFASVTLSRLECLLGDYTASLSALSPILSSPLVVTKLDLDPKTSLEVVHGVFSARLSLTYHAGISFFMLRRYKDAISILGEICSYMQRGFKTGQLRKLPNSDQLFKNYDRLIALLAICMHVCPQANVEESLAKTIREKHSAQLSKEAYTDLFVYCAPKFVSPAVPQFVEDSLATDNAHKNQISLLEQELSCQSAFRKLSSYLKLYTSIALTKLTAFGNDPKLLLSLKLKLRQLESNDTETPSLTNASLKSALDIHYYMDNGMVHVDEAEKQRRFENYFLAQISQSLDIRKEIISNISTVV